jgi:protein-S-isoprenylcysteine O-methyltransferase Ste14
VSVAGDGAGRWRQEPDVTSDHDQPERSSGKTSVRRIRTPTRLTFWTLAAFYALIAFEFFYMATPFAAYFYSIYGPGLNLFARTPGLAWLDAAFLPHIVVETASRILNARNAIGAILFLAGLAGFAFAATQVYWRKLARRGPATGGLYRLLRHPQYASLALSGLGLAILWPRYSVLLLFVVMLFAYYFLAKLEEHECESRYGRAYAEYRRKTGMFLPAQFSLASSTRLTSRSRIRSALTTLGLFSLVVAAALAVASRTRDWALDNLYLQASADAVYLSVAKIDAQTLARLACLASRHPQVAIRLAGAGAGAHAKFINYVVPAEWDIPEIPMHGVAASRDHLTPAHYDHTRYKIVFTKTDIGPGAHVAGREILVKAARRAPVAEAWVDLSRERVLEVRDPPARVMYAGIPVPLY